MSQKIGRGTAPAYSVPQFAEVLKAVAGALPKGLEGTDPKEVIKVVQTRGEALGLALNRAIKEVLSEPPIGRYFMTVKLGTYKSVAEMRQAILDSGRKISDSVEKILQKIPLSEKETEVDLYEVSGKELDFVSPALSIEDIYQRASRFGFKICPEEVWVLACKQCSDGKSRAVGMKPLDGRIIVLGSMLLGGGGSISGCFTEGVHRDLLDPRLIWVFVWPRHK